MGKLIYISTDVEYSGDSQDEKGQGSLLSLGSCELGNINNSFYRELQPINRIYNEAAMKAIAPGFQFIGEDVHLLTGSEILDRLQEYAMPPDMAMSEYKDWLMQFSQNSIREIACPIKFDGGLSSYYFRKYVAGHNPLSHSGEDGNSLLRGVLGDLNISFSRLGIQSIGGDLPHNALQDAQIQAIWLEFLLKLMEDNIKSPGSITTLYHKKGKETFLTSLEVNVYVDWVRDMVSSIRNTKFGEEVNYSSIL